MPRTNRFRRQRFNAASAQIYRRRAASSRIIWWYRRRRAARDPVNLRDTAHRRRMYMQSDHIPGTTLVDQQEEIWFWDTRFNNFMRRQSRAYRWRFLYYFDAAERARAYYDYHRRMYSHAAAA